MWASLWGGPVPSPPRAVCNVVSSSGEVCSNIDNTINSKTTAKTISRILLGVVVGETRSGKTCLIRRLRGEDPFVHVENDRSSKNKNLMALIPWKMSDVITNDCQKLYPVEGDEVVQLYVSEGKSFSYTRNDDRAFQKQWSSVLQSQRGKDLDFIVWIIDLRMKNILDFVHDGLDTLFARNNREGGKASDGIKQQSPIHVCILLNFRDCIEKKNVSQTIVCQIQKTIKQVIESYKEDRDRQNHVRRCQLQSHSTEIDRIPTILVYESSMSDCYGLNNLLSFISLPYLSHKERDFQRLAEQLRTQHVQWKDERLINKGIEYEEYINQRLIQQKISPKTSINHQDLSSGERKSPSHNIHHQMASSPGEINLLSRPRRSPGSNQQETCTSAKNQHGDADNVSSSVILSLPALNDTESRTLFARPNQLFTGSKVTSNSRVPVNDSLDLFFSDDDEELADEQSETNGNDGSDDEDFFIDIDRERRVQVDIAAVRTRTKQLSSNGAGHINPIVNEDNSSLEENIDERVENHGVTCAKLSDDNVAEEGVDDERNNEQTPSESHNGIKTHTSERYDKQQLEADTEDDNAADNYSYPISESKSKVVNSIDKSHKEVLDTNTKTASLVLDSGDEDSLAGDIQQSNPGDKVIKPDVPSTSSMTKHNSSTPVTKSGIPMSSAARAAIDAARKEAEAMMNVQSQQTNDVPTTIPDEKREKKIKKRNKDEKKEKKKKKDRR